MINFLSLDSPQKAMFFLQHYDKKNFPDFNAFLIIFLSSYLLNLFDLQQAPHEYLRVTA